MQHAETHPHAPALLRVDAAQPQVVADSWTYAALAQRVDPVPTTGPSMHLAQFAINGNSPGTAEIDFVEVAGGGGSCGTAEIDFVEVAGDDRVRDEATDIVFASDSAPSRHDRG